MGNIVSGAFSDPLQGQSPMGTLTNQTLGAAAPTIRSNKNKNYNFLKNILIAMYQYYPMVDIL